MIVVITIIERPVVAVTPWIRSLSAASEAVDVVADIVLRILGFSSCNTCRAIEESSAPQHEC